MKNKEILRLTLPEIDLDNCAPLLEGIANDSAPSQEPVTKEQFLEAAKGLKEAFRQSRERIKKTTVEDVLRGWSEKHEAYLAISDRVFKHVHLSILSTFFRRLIFLGLSEEYLSSLPSGQIVLATKTVDEIFATFS